MRQDQQEAVRLYELAASQGDGDGQRNLARLYRDGNGVRQDEVVAFAWLNLAASAEEPNSLALAERDQIATQLTRNQVFEGQRLSREWKRGEPLGKSRIKPASAATQTRSATKVSQESNADKFPVRPKEQPGLTTCTTRCENSTCFRTYDSGKKIEYEAQRKWNPLTNRFDWDPGTC